MTITGITFFIFLIATWAIYNIVPKKLRWISLLCESIVFYLFSGWKSIIFLAATVCVTYIFSRLLEKKQKKLYIVLPIIINAGILCAVKYSVFAFSSLGSIIPSFETLSSGIAEKLIVPLGISFYTFQTISYLVDVYKKKFAPEHNFAKFSLYITFFPHIIQGPIARYEQLAPQLYEGHSFDYDKTVKGILLILWGLIKKLIIAEKVGLVVNGIFGNQSYYSTFFVISGAVLYAIQLYADFSGYMNIVTGVADVFGISLTPNFDTPYSARNISDFWRRWHMSLSSWLRDYIYIPLGGSRKGTVRKCINLMIVFIVSGIWHGAAWTFIVWGLYHGIISVFNNFTYPIGKKIRNKLNIKETSWYCSLYQIITTTALVCIGWIFFRASSLTEAFNMILGIFNLELLGLAENTRILCRTNGLTESNGIVLAVFILIFVVVEILNYKKFILSEKLTKVPFIVRLILIVAAMLSIICFASGQGGFMYAQF